MLRNLGAADRDLLWTEWLRNATGNAGRRTATADVERQLGRWKNSIERTPADALRARWLMWTLTSTDRNLRDTATEALYWFGRAAPADLFNLAVDALAINDAYVGERVMAAAYGVAAADAGRYTAEHDPRTALFAEAFEPFLEALVKALLGQGDQCATTPTYHALTRYYASSIFECARMFTAELLPESVTFPIAFAPGPAIVPLREGDERRDDARRSMHINFHNYTLGRLFRDRKNYDDTHAGHHDATDHICGVVNSFGWTTDRFGELDRAIDNRSRSRDPERVERYGKKYAWIGLYLVSGLLADAGHVSDWLEVDIDPTFPQPSRQAPVVVPTWARTTPAKERDWLVKGLVKVPDDVINAATLDGELGPWTLLHAEMTSKDAATGRNTFGLFNTVLVERCDADEFIEALRSVSHPGRDVIDVPSAYYTFAGEIGWHERFAAPEPGRPLAEQYQGMLRQGGRGITFESLTHQYSWESHHSSRNQVRAWVPSKLLSTALSLRSVPAGFDQVDREGRLASHSYTAPQGFTGHMLYVRSDVIREYAKDRVIATFGWGERQTQLGGGIIPAPLQRAYWAHRNVWRGIWYSAASSAEL